MKRYALFVGLVITVTCSAQDPSSNARASIAELYNAAGLLPNTVSKLEIKGSPMLNENWGKGSVKFSNGRILNDVLLQLNIFNNQLHCQIDSVEFTFVEAVEEFSFEYNHFGKNVSVLFRSGYPGTGPSANFQFYQVLAESSRFQLLKHVYKTIQDHFDYTTAPGKAYQQSAELFIYDKVGKTMVLVKNKQPLDELLPGESEGLVQLTGDKRPKFRSEKELAQLLARLNR